MRTTRWLHRIHLWTGIASGFNVLLLSLTGAYLVFSEEIESAFSDRDGSAAVLTVDMDGETPFQTALEQLAALHPGTHPSVMFRDRNATSTWELYVEDDEHNHHHYTLDETTGAVYSAEDPAHRLNEFIVELHGSLLMGNTGILILGFIGFLLLVSTVTGLLIYGPFMKAAIFGRIRLDRGLRRASADFHKVLGAGSLAFNLLMAVTGVALTVGFMGVRIWVYTETQALVHEADTPAADAGALPPIDEAVRQARLARPDIPVTTAIYPGLLQGPNHYMCFHAHSDSLTQYIPVVTLVPINAPEQVSTLPIPWWVAAVLICVPLHFGDFAGLGMKVVYCVLGLSAGALSISGALQSSYRLRRRWRLAVTRKEVRATSPAPAEQT